MLWVKGLSQLWLLCLGQVIVRMPVQTDASETPTSGVELAPICSPFDAYVTMMGAHLETSIGKASSKLPRGFNPHVQ